MKNIKLIEVPSEIGAGTRGASLGIDAIKIAALDFMSNFFVHFPSEKIETENHLLFEPISSPYAKRINGVLIMYERVSKAVKDTIKNNFFPVVISGDHSTAGGTIAGIKAAKPNSRLGYYMDRCACRSAYTLHNTIRQYAWNAAFSIYCRRQ